jgi:RNase adapter protein RapZ
MDLTVISGLSGGGKSTALHALEDLGVYCVDNCPIPLLPELVELVRRSDGGRAIAVCVDAREAHYLASFEDVVARLEQHGVGVEVLFVEANREVLVRRYAETRRMHPMGELPDAIDREREAIAPIRAKATTTIDTSTLTGRQLRQLVRDRYGAGGGGAMRVVLQSFAYKRGVPSEADIVLDSRFLANPHEHDALRPLSGLHEPVARFVLEQPDAQELLRMAEALVRFTVPRSAAEGRSYLTIAIGCTGGQHRSVALVEALKARLAVGDPPETAVRTVVRHRDVGRSG